MAELVELWKLKYEASYSDKILSSGWNIELIGQVGSPGENDSRSLRARDSQFVCLQVVQNKLIKDMSGKENERRQKREKVWSWNTEEPPTFRKGEEESMEIKSVWVLEEPGDTESQKLSEELFAARADIISSIQR